MWRRIWTQYGGGSNSGGNRNGRKNSGCGTALLIVCVVLVLLAVLSAVMGAASSGGNIQKSTYQREKLPASAVVETGYYTDEGGWFSNRNELEAGMKSFYRETGVQPYLYLLPNGTTTSVSELTGFAEELYGELFQDEGHFLLVFCDDNNGSYNCGYTVGSQAKTVIGLAGGVLLHSDQAGHALAGHILAADGVAGALGGCHEHVHVSGRRDLLITDIEAVSKGQSLAGGQVRSDVLGIHGTDGFFIAAFTRTE